MQVLPHTALSKIIRHYLVLEGAQPLAGTYRLFADGNTGLVFNLANDTLQHSSYLYGQVNTYHDLSLSGNINLIVVVFRPYGAYHLWGVPATEWSDRFFPAADFLGPQIQDLSSTLLKADGVNERVRLLDHFLLRQLDKNIQPDPVVVQAVQEITSHAGTLPVLSLLKTLSLNERTLERKFKLSTGISPKQYSGIVRLNASAKRIQRMKTTDRLTGIAYESGYFDQAHFIRDFRKYTGMSPHQLHHEVSALALNFLQL